MSGDTVADLRRCVAELQRELDERTAKSEALQLELTGAGEQQTAAAEVLQVINSSHGELAPVFGAVLDRALALCCAAFGVLWRYDGGLVRAAAIRGATPEYADFLTRGAYRPDAGSANGRLLAGASIVHQADVADTEDYRSGNELPRAIVELGGGRTLLAVALRRGETFLGSIVIYRREVCPFVAKEIALLQNFAAQAVVAMENARLITETREALEQQTASAEVLKAVSRSTFDLRAVLQTVVSAAHQLCQSDYSVIFRQEGDEYRWAAGYGISAEYEERERRAVIRPGTETVIGRAVLAGHAVQIADAKADPLYQGEAESDARAMLGVPLLRDGVAIGGIGMARNRVEPFTDKQVELVTTFADQAVIAIENARLITETREALEQQTATAEVLQVINASPGDLAPVFDAMLDKALGLCGAAFGCLWTYDGERVHAVALRGAPPAFAEFLTRVPHPVGPDNAHGRLLRGEPVVHIADVADDEAYRAGDPVRRNLVDLGGGRTLLAVALRKDDTFLGDIVIYRTEVRPFTDREVALLQNFAAQAVIAMENARLLGELRERTNELVRSVEELKALNEVSQAVSSTLDLRAVLSTILARSVALSGADARVSFR